jgi:hypothetical protein
MLIVLITSVASAWLVLWRGGETSTSGAGTLPATEPSLGDDAPKGPRAEDRSADHPWLSRLVGQLAARLDRLEEAVTKLSQEDKPQPVKEAPSQPATTTPADYANIAESTIKGEPKDAAWDAQFRERAAGAINQAELAGTKVRAIDCGQSLCRMELQLPTNVRPMSVMQALLAQGPNGGVWASVDETVTPPGTALLYVARETASLPQAPIASAAP